jgi:hypothetical protein
MHHDTARRFIHVPRAQEVIRVMRAKIAITVNIVRKRAGRVACANDKFLKDATRVKYWELIADNLRKPGFQFRVIL